MVSDIRSHIQLCMGVDDPNLSLHTCTESALPSAVMSTFGLVESSEDQEVIGATSCKTGIGNQELLKASLVS